MPFDATCWVPPALSLKVSFLVPARLLAIVRVPATTPLPLPDKITGAVAVEGAVNDCSGPVDSSAASRIVFAKLVERTVVRKRAVANRAGSKNSSATKECCALVTGEIATNYCHLVAGYGTTPIETGAVVREIAVIDRHAGGAVNGPVAIAQSPPVVSVPGLFELLIASRKLHSPSPEVLASLRLLTVFRLRQVGHGLAWTADGISTSRAVTRIASNLSHRGQVRLSIMATL